MSDRAAPPNPPDPLRQFHRKLDAIAEGLRGEMEPARAEAFEGIEENPVFVIRAQSLCRGQASAPLKGRDLALLEEALPLSPLSNREIAVGLLAWESLRGIGPRKLGLGGRRLTAGKSAKFLFLGAYALVVAVAVAATGLWRAIPHQIQKMSAQPERLIPYSITVFFLGLCCFFYFEIKRSMKAKLAARKTARFHSFQAKVGAVGSDISATLGMIFLYVLGGCAGVFVFHRLPGLLQKRYGLGSSTWHTASMAVALAVSVMVPYLFLAGNLLRSREFRRVERRVEAWRENVRERMAVRSSEDDQP